MENELFCKECGAELDGKTLFCTKCGAAVDAEQERAIEQINPGIHKVVPKNRAEANMLYSKVPSKNSLYAPVSVKGFLGIFLLMCIPVVNLVLLVVWACGGCKKQNKQNYARAALLLIVLVLLLVAITAAVLCYTIGLDAAKEFIVGFLGKYIKIV